MNVTKKGYLTKKKKKIACDQTALDRQTGLEKKKISFCSKFLTYVRSFTETMAVVNYKYYLNHE